MKAVLRTLTVVAITVGSANLAKAACTEKRDASGNISRQCITTSGGNSVSYDNVAYGNGQVSEQTIGQMPKFDLSQLDPALVRVPSQPRAQIPAKVPAFDLSAFLRSMGL